MEYTKIELKGYKRLQLNNIDLISIEPKQVIQAILGTNGSGKSSLLREITPLPSHHGDYEKDGYKLLELTHSNHQYTILNQFDGKSGRYQIHRDNVSIFEGSTVTDFRTLIKQEFGITPEIQSLIDGVTKFSTMDVSKRRQWFTLLSKADYTFALQYYAQIKSRIRDLQGSLNITQTRYTSEASKIMSEEEIKETRELLERYSKVLNELLENKPKVPFLKIELENKINSQDSEIRTLIDNLKQSRLTISRLVPSRYSHEDLSIAGCQQTVYRIQAQLENEQRKEQEYHDRLSELTNQTQASTNVTKYTEQELFDIKNDLVKKAIALKNSIAIPTDIEASVLDFKSAFDYVYTNISEIISSFPTEGTSEFNNSNYELRSLKYKTQLDHVAILKQNIERYTKEVQDFEYAKQNHHRVCPNCNHEWFHGFEERKYLFSKQQVSELNEKETVLTTELLHSLNWLTECERIFNLRELLNRNVRSWPILKPLWDALLPEVTQSPKKAQMVLEDFLRDIPLLINLQNIQKSINETDEQIEFIKAQANVDLKSKQELIEKTEYELASVQEMIRKHSYELRFIKRHLTQLELIKNYIEQLETLLLQKDENVAYISKSLEVEHYNRLISLFRNEISILEQSISKINVQQNMLMQYKQQIDEHTEHIRLLKMAEQAMSPSCGLIAKGLTGFINWFISRMNLFVKHIWTYPLEALPVSIGEDLDLDYQFPVRIDDRFPAPDIKPGKCNNSTCEIFDLAFRIIAMECLGFKNYPLQLDEFGASFDHQHRHTAFQVVTSLTTTTDIPQIFMVSHFEQSYGGLRNCDVTVLHADNVVLPEGVEINGRTKIN